MEMKTEEPSPQPPSPELITIIAESLDYMEKKLIEFSYSWTIENFLSRSWKIGERLESPTFSCKAKDSHKWHLIAYPNGFDATNKDYIAMFLCLSECDKSEVKAMFEFSVLGPKLNKFYALSVNGIFTFGREGQSINGDVRYLSRAGLLNNENDLLTNNNLTIVCDVKLITDFNCITDLFETKPFQIPDCHLIDDISLLFENRKFSDLTIVIGEREIPAHKVILAARSPVFATMVEIKLETPSRMIVPDTSYEVFRQLLHFIYRGKVEHLDKLAPWLIVAANKYRLPRLKALCEKALGTSIGVHNAMNVLTIADFCGANQLKLRVINFISKHALELKDSAEFQEMFKTQPRLMVEVFSLLAKRINGHSSIKK